MPAPSRPHPTAPQTHRESGQAIVLIVVMLAVLLGAAALTVDVGYAYYTHRSLQADADAAALAGAAALPDATTAKTLATQYSGSAGSKNQHPNLPAVDTSVTLKCLGPTGCSTMNSVHVVEHATVNTWFARILGLKQFNVSAKATACSPGFGEPSLVDESTTSCPLAPGPCTLGYPYTSSNPRTSQDFNESEVLRTFAPSVAGPGDTIKVWYNDEHGLVLGIRAVTIKTSKTSSTTTNYSVTPLSTDPGSATNPLVGTTAMTGDFAGNDPVDRPEYPALFITDITDNLKSTSGDWQWYGTPIPPDGVFGSWKGAVRVVDKTKSPAVTSVTPDADPAKNDWNLAYGDPVPPGQKDEGYGAEARWNVDDLGLQPGHAYRLQFMVHDGDQRASGGDVGEACMHVVIPG